MLYFVNDITIFQISISIFNSTNYYQPPSQLSEILEMLNISNFTTIWLQPL